MTSNEALKPEVVGLAEAARDLLEAQRKDCRTVGYRGDLWSFLEAALTRSTDTPVCASTEEAVDAALDAWERTAGTRRDMMRNALNAALAASQAPETIERLREALELFTGQAVFDPDTRRASVDEFVVSKARAALSSIPEPLIMPLEGSK